MSNLFVKIEVPILRLTAWEDEINNGEEEEEWKKEKAEGEKKN